MLERVTFIDWGNGNHVEVYTDGYAYDPISMSLHLISLAGNDGAVKAVSAAIVGHREVNIRRDHDADLNLRAHYGVNYRILSVKLDCAAVHQIVADERFFHPGERGDHLLTAPAEIDPWERVYQRVLSQVATPLVPQWAEWICSRLSQEGHLKELQGTVRVVEARAEEFVLDEIVSEGLEQNLTEIPNRGGVHARLDQ